VKFDLLTVLLLILMGGAFLAVSVMGVWNSRKEAGARRWLMTVGWVFVAIGATGFFGSAFLAVGGLRWWRLNFEWPMGFAKGIVKTPDGFFVVPHTPTGRVQVYDANWKFQRGWFVDASAGTFKLGLESSNKIEIITARRQMRYVYALDGTLLTQTTYSPKNYGDFAPASEASFVPTRWWLWSFTGPFYSWSVAAIGGGLLFTAERIKRRRKLAS
jgi:hypothetical protein